ncbi:MAG: nucleotide exchange factor GrpE, partial [Spirochaetia bacterium]
MSNEKRLRDKQALDAGSQTANEDETPDMSVKTEGADEAEAGTDESLAALSSIEENEESEPNNQPGLTAEESLETRIAELEAENVEFADGLLRKTADFENYRKRMVREKEEFVAYANRELLLDIVSIVDDFERAIRSADESHDF